MPQMMPMFWLMHLLFFLLIFFYFMNLFFYMFNPLIYSSYKFLLFKNNSKWNWMW